jgi:dihydroorotate dehydrogenase electron transfer subunit
MKPLPARLLQKKKLTEDIFSFWLQSPAVARTAEPAQFVQIRVGTGLDPFLRRPISIAGVDSDRFVVVFKVRGRGTRMLADKSEGDDLDIIGPLGRPIPVIENKKILLIGGGLGSAPLRFLAQTAAGKNQIFFIIGAQTEKELILADDSKQFAREFEITTEDGSSGYQGLATDRLPAMLKKAKPDVIFACGPEGMLKAVQTGVRGIPTYGFFESRMGCGYGLCLGCALKRKTGGYLRVCQDGPVFDLSDVEL